jgi:hypothetical protein
MHHLERGPDRRHLEHDRRDIPLSQKGGQASLGTHFPHYEKGEDPHRDNYRFAKKHPHTTAEHMDRCKDMLTMFVRCITPW